MLYVDHVHCAYTGNKSSMSMSMSMTYLFTWNSWCILTSTKFGGFLRIQLTASWIHISEHPKPGGAHSQIHVTRSLSHSYLQITSAINQYMSYPSILGAGFFGTWMVFFFSGTWMVFSRYVDGVFYIEGDLILAGKDRPFMTFQNIEPLWRDGKSSYLRRCQDFWERHAATS